MLWSAEEISQLRAKAGDKSGTEQGTSTAGLWEQVVAKANMTALR